MRGCLTFKYGVMGSSKTARALIQRFNYLENGMHPWLIKPSIDIRDGETKIRSRIGLEADVCVISCDESIVLKYPGTGVIIADEAQFFTSAQIDDLRKLADAGVEVFCYGLRTNFRAELFEGSKRLMELADKIEEIPHICSCGHTATINARVDENNNLITDGEIIKLGGDDMYRAMCHRCWTRQLMGQNNEDNKAVRYTTDNTK